MSPTRLTSIRAMVNMNMSRYMRRVDVDSLMSGQQVTQQKKQGDVPIMQHSYSK